MKTLLSFSLFCVYISCTYGDVSTAKKVFIHVMPWFLNKADNGGKWGLHWTMNKQNPDEMDGDKHRIASHYYPLIGPYSSGDRHVIDWQLQLMKLSGVTGIFIDWPGTANVLDYHGNLINSEAIIEGAIRNGLEFAIVYEDHNLGMTHDQGLVKDIYAQGKADMIYLRDNYFTKSNYVRLNGAPLLLDFGPQTLNSPSNWTEVFSVFKEKPTFLTLWDWPIDHRALAGAANSQGEFAWINENYIDDLNKWYKNRTAPIKVGVAFPGFHTYYYEGGWGDSLGWKIDVSLATFEKTLDMALAGTDIVQVATWNDYGEGTMIEPTREFGYGFLTLLQKKLGVNHNQADLELVTKQYNEAIKNTTL